MRLSKALGLGGRDFNVCFVDDERISAFNTAFRGKAYPTDVLSFPWQADEAFRPGPEAGGVAGIARRREPSGKRARLSVALARGPAPVKDSRRNRKRTEPHRLNAEPGREFEGFLGDIVISVEAAERNAVVEGHTTRTEISRLILHGLLHLLGLDHETDRGEMATLEHGLRARLGVSGEKSRARKSAVAGAQPTGSYRSRRGLKSGAPEA
jgi:rRNA maturation RNase YbeY